MSKSSSRKGELTEDIDKEGPLDRIRNLLGEETASNTLSKLNTTNGGEIALTLKEIKRKVGSEGLTEFVNNYILFEYLQAKEEYDHGDKEIAQKDLIVAKLVIREYGGILETSNLNKEVVEKVRQV